MHTKLTLTLAIILTTTFVDKMKADTGCDIEATLEVNGDTVTYCGETYEASRQRIGSPGYYVDALFWYDKNGEVQILFPNDNGKHDHSL